MPAIPIVAAVVSVSSAVTVAAAAGGFLASAAAIAATVTAVGAVTAAVGSVTGNQKLVKFGSILGAVGVIGGLANSAGMFGNDGFFGNAAQSAGGGGFDSLTAADAAAGTPNAITEPIRTGAEAASGMVNAGATPVSGAAPGAAAVSPTAATTAPSSAGFGEGIAPAPTASAAAPTADMGVGMPDVPATPPAAATQAPTASMGGTPTATGGTLDGQVAAVGDAGASGGWDSLTATDAGAGGNPAITGPIRTGIQPSSMFTNMMDMLNNNRGLTALVGGMMQGAGQSYAAGKQYELNQQELQNRIRNSSATPSGNYNFNLAARNPWTAPGMIQRGG